MEIAYGVLRPWGNNSSPGRSRTVSESVAPQRLLIRINRQDAQYSDPVAKPTTAVRKIGRFIWDLLLSKKEYCGRSDVNVWD